MSWSHNWATASAMRFLCLHGMGTNSRIFEAQTAAIRYLLGSEHTFEFIDGAVPTSMAPMIEPFVSSSDESLQYVDVSSRESCQKGLQDLDAYVTEEGPFDGVMAFSQGAGLAASLIVHRAQQDVDQARLHPAFDCAIFFSGGIPENPRTLLSEEPRSWLQFEEYGELIEIPTVHIWGRNDRIYPNFGPVLSRLCKGAEREELVHDGGHEIPGAKDMDTVEAAAKLINRTLERTKATR